MRLSVVVPVLNEQDAIEGTLAAIRRCAPDAEIVVVDGGSIDATVQVAGRFANQIVNASRGRALQQNFGAAQSTGEVLAFVHADTIVPATFFDDIASALEDPKVCGGRFDVRLDDGRPISSLLGKMISLRSRLSRSATGDQAIFVRKTAFDRLGGFPEIPICEDLAFMRRLKHAGRVACLRSQVITSARRWHRGGFLRTILRMWTIKLLYFCGFDPARLVRWYDDVR